MSWLTGLSLKKQQQIAGTVWKHARAASLWTQIAVFTRAPPRESTKQKYILLHSQEPALPAMKENKNRPVRRPSTPTQPMRPRADHGLGRDHQVRPQAWPENHLYTASRRRSEWQAGAFAGTARGPGGFTLGCRGYALINQGGLCSSFRELRDGSITIEMIL